jgi:hypothetical protein
MLRSIKRSLLAGRVVEAGKIAQVDRVLFGRGQRAMPRRHRGLQKATRAARIRWMLTKFKVNYEED